MDEAGLNGHVTRRVTPAVAPHPVGSSSTSRPRGVEAGLEPEYADEVVAVSDAAAASYDESAGGDWTLAPAEKTGRRSPVRRQPTESAEEAQARVLAALSRAYDCGMNRASADQQLTEYLLDRYRPHPLWSYSAQQHAALDEWNRVRNRSDRGAAARVA
jgi:hypothetical protein